MKRAVLLVLLSGVLLSCLAGEYPFKHLEVADGLSGNQVTAIYKDRRGFMWLGTSSGLNRYDGYSIKIYRNRQDDSTSLPDNYIEHLQEDADGNLWVRTAAGYVVYNPDTDDFDRNVEARMKLMGIEGEPDEMFIDREKSLWIFVSGKGIYRRKAGMKEAEWMSGSMKWTAISPVSSMTDSAEGLLVVLQSGALLCVDRETLALKWRNDGIASEISMETGFKLFVDRGECVWIYSSVGLWCYQLLEKEWLTRSLRTDDYDMVRAMAQDQYGNIWIGYDQGGIVVQDVRGNRTRLINDPTDASSLSNNTVTTLYEDEIGTMWVGTYKKGISYHNESLFKFGFFEVSDINCVVDDGDDVLWLGTNGEGLVRWNRRTGEQEQFVHTEDAGSLSNNAVVCMLKDSRGTLWVGTFYGGLNRYENGRFVHYRAQPGRKGALANDNIWSLAEDADGNIWIGTLGGGLQCFNPQTETFTTYGDSNPALDPYISSLCVNDDNQLIIGSSNGIAFLNLQTRKITSFGELTNENIIQVYVDSRKWLWIATREGLNVYDARRNVLCEVPLSGDLSPLMVLGVTEDLKRNMWVTTGDKLINVQVAQENAMGEPVFHCYAYNHQDGLQHCDFNQRSLVSLHSGEIVVGGFYGLNYFHPDKVKYNSTVPRVIFSDFRLFNETIKVGQKYDGRVVLPKDLNSLDKLELTYRQNMFTIFFATDNYLQPEKARYFYRLEGFTDNWLEASSTLPHATYTNLAPGNYTLHIRAINSDGYEGTEVATLHIVILPPFWATAWAYLFYGLLMLGGVVLMFYLIYRRERNKFRLRQLEEDTKKQNELNEMKFRFFTNVSHELRTPLTLIISPLENLINRMSDAVQKSELEMVYHNAQRLLNQVNQLLDFRRSEMAGMRLSLSEGDLVSYVHSICNSFLILSEKKHVHLTFFSSMKSLHMLFDEDKIGKVVMNLLSNAFKFTPDGGRVDVALEMSEESSGRVEIRVADTGIGIDDADKAHVFERFYRVDQKDMHIHPTGSGIGLSLVQDFVLLHEGTVRVLDNVGGRGSVFVVELPVKRPEMHAALSVKTAQNVAADKGDEKPVALLVEDNEELITFMRSNLGLYFRIRTASNGLEAWKMLADMKPDIIVSDVMMPEMDGNELCRRVKSDVRTSNIPLILLTAKVQMEDKLEGLSLGADDYLTKPFNMEILLLRMQKLIALNKQNRAKNRIEPEPSEIIITSMDEKLIENAIRYVETNIARSELSVEELSRELGMSRVHLYKKLLQITNKTPIEFIRVIRLKRAAQLLRESQQSVSEIAYQVGFNNPKYFSKYFKDEFGVLPSVYQKSEGKSTSETKL